MKLRTGPAGVHIFERRSGLNLLLDEITVSPNVWSIAPRFVSIALTNTCDLSCPHCYAPKHLATLDTARLIGWLSELDANGCLGVGFGGGEPTLHRGLLDLCSYVTKFTEMAVSITTHGHRLDDSLLESLEGNVQFVRVSIDGVGQTYERLRGRSFASLTGQIRKIAQISKLGINYVVNSETLRDLNEAIQLATSVGASEFLLLPQRKTLYSAGIDVVTVGALRDWVKSYRGRLRLSVSEGESAGFPTCDPLEAEVGLRSYAFISADGELRRSSFHAAGVRMTDAGLLGALSALENMQSSNIV